MDQDRNFDDLADRFASRVVNSRKGQLRRAVIWRDIHQHLADRLTKSKSLDVLDVGGGAGHFSIEFASQGHRVTYNDLSEKMMEQAQSAARQKSLEQCIAWRNQPYQELEGRYDFILCHAVLEWLSEPQRLLPHLAKLLKPGGYLSFCFYNSAGRVYRNLICGNFKLLQREEPVKPDRRSLTPSNPSSLSDVLQWINVCQFNVIKSSGIRVFSDYALERRGGLQSPDDVLSMELEYGQQEPYKWLGRYLHFLMQKP